MKWPWRRRLALPQSGPDRTAEARALRAELAADRPKLARIAEAVDSDHFREAVEEALRPRP